MDLSDDFKRQNTNGILILSDMTQRTQLLNYSMYRCH